MVDDLKESRNKVLAALSNTFHKYGLWIIVSAFLGAYGSMQACKMYYNTKMTESIAIGGLVHQSKVYSITPK